MFHVIVWATDGSKPAENALPLAKELARSSGAKFVAVHVEEKGLGRAEALAQAEEADVAHRTVLQRKVDELRQEGLDAELRWVDGIPGKVGHVIADVAREARADLVVVGSHGHSSLVGLLLGSVTLRLLQIAPAPVLVVPPPEDR
ncbi:universal stress protein [Pseudonocardia sp. H11422]|uniref:universal stress protein n=1 Tax=Pseudonocardia sp. H11422 TaxID=2835866 RepID=UPI001BDCD446|nr:universal stress protein [Pseudonocardia sp. H11422]